MCSCSWRQVQNVFHAMQVALVIFLTVALVLVSAFFMYHLVLILSGMTSYESYKWTMMYKMRAVEEEAEQIAKAAAALGTTDVPCEEPAWSATGVWRALRGSRKVQGMPANIYDRGPLRNLQDALAPPAWASQALMASGSEAKQSNTGSKKAI